MPSASPAGAGGEPAGRVAAPRACAAARSQRSAAAPRRHPVLPCDRLYALGMTDSARRLRARAQELDVLLDRLARDEQSVRADRADATADDEHDPEGVTLSSEWQRIEALRRATQAERAEIDAALERVAAGTYGVCVSCGLPIPVGRLAARPMATMCVACAERAG